MSDTEMPTPATPTAAPAASGMNPADAEFLIACLRNSVGGTLQVDAASVAEALNFKNPRSVANKISALKKQYGIPLGSSLSKKTDGGGSSDPTIPTTPNKNKVVKTRAPRTPKTPKAPKVAKKPKSTDKVSDSDIESPLKLKSGQEMESLPDYVNDAEVKKD